MRKYLLISLVSIFSVFFLFNLNFTETAKAKNLKDAFSTNLKTTAEKTPYDISNNDGSLLTKNIANIISIALSLLGVIFVILTVYGGFLYMTARGNEEQTKKGQAIIVQALIGLIIVLTAYAISYFAFKSLI